MTARSHVAIVTGAASGIGAESAARLARRGFRVVVADLSAARADQVAAEITAGVTPARGAKAVAAGCDVTDPAAVADLVAGAVELGDLDVLINCAGVAGEAHRLEEAPIELWRQVIDVNLWGVVHMCRAVTPVLRERGRGSIVNVASIAALQGSRGQVPYSAAKAAVVGLTIAAAKELISSGVRVNAVAPGFIATPMTEAMPPRMRQAWRLDELTLGGGLGSAGDVAACIEFLATDDAAFVTGVTLPVDGGFRLGYP